MDANMPYSKTIYLDKIRDLTEEINELQKASNLVGYFRLIIFFIGCAAAFWGLYYDAGSFVILPIIASFALFIFLVVYSANLKKKIHFKSNLVIVNEKSVERVDERWHTFPDQGKEFINKKHNYSYDLDIFGNGSLFQWINSTATFYGRKKLSQRLIGSEMVSKEIYERQEAIKELAEKIDFRQNLQAQAMIDKNCDQDPSPLILWIEDTRRLFNNSRIKKTVIRALPLITITSILLIIVLSKSYYYLLGASVLTQLFLIGKYGKKMSNVFDITSRFNRNITTYRSFIEMIENESFSSVYLVQLKNNIEGAKRSASYYFIKLETILDYVNLRFSSIHFIINLVTLWDFHCLIAIENWKDDTGKVFNDWLHTIGEFEELSSFSIIRFDNPQWPFPVINDRKYFFSGKQINHPLIPAARRVENDFTASGNGHTSIITGSNMSGKSTMLRTVGINLVMAYCGVPVCAGNFECSLMEIYTSMRIDDNLEENISTFYAELLRIKMVLEASKREKNTLFLLDEILRGTNTRDRKIGVEAVIKNLVANGAMGMIATHDLEIAHWAVDSDLNIDNYFFTESYKNGRIFFDYKLYRGISNSSDAVYLMKMMGIEI